MHKESKIEYIKNLVYGKLIHKTINTDFSTLGEQIFGKKYNNTEVRKRMYGMRFLFNLLEKEQVVNNNNDNNNHSKNYPEKTTINIDGTHIDEKIINADKEQLKNPEFLLKEHGYDSSIFELIKATSSKWNVYSNSEGIQDLYSSRITVKQKECPIDLNTLCVHFLESIKEYKPEIYTKKHDVSNKQLRLEIPVFDLHYGKLCWNVETGYGNYDHKITENLLWNVIEKTLEKVDTNNIKEIIFPIGNDFFNTDNVTDSTTKGTQQFNDIRWQKMYLNGFNLIVDVLNRLSTIAPVKVFYIPGNHDKMASFFLLTYLDAWFRESNVIEVDKSIRTRYYYHFGNNLIGYTHKLDKNKIKTTMQHEARDLWGKSKYCEWHNGHLHSEQAIIEQGGLIIRNLSALVATDSWHYEEGYTGAIRKLQSFLWDDEDGLVSILYTIVKE